MNYVAVLAPHEIIEDERIYGHAHVTIRGRCGDAVTSDDIRKRFYHPVFGGRRAEITGNTFSVISHTD